MRGLPSGISWTDNSLYWLLEGSSWLCSELDSRLKRDHAGTAVASQSDSEQSGGRGGGVRQRTEAGLCGRLSRNTGQHDARQAEVGMVEDVEELSVESQLHPLAQRKPLGDVEVAPEEVGAAQSVAAEISELAVLR